MPNSSVWDFLITPVFAVAIGIVFLCCVIILVTRWKKLSRAQKIVIGVMILICLLYLGLVLWLSISFGRPPHEPVPSPPGSN